MKNNKTTQIFLAIALIGIWGTIFYRVYENMQGNGDSDFQISNFPIIDTTAAIKEAGFSLRMDYGDPFLGKSFSPMEGNSDNLETVTTSVAAPPPPVNRPNKPKQRVQFPKIVYQGLITNKATGQKRAILKINQQTHRVKSGQKVNDVQLVQLYRDSVRLYYKGEMKTVVK